MDETIEPLPRAPPPNGVAQRSRASPVGRDKATGFGDRQVASEFRAALTPLARGRNETSRFSSQSAYDLGYRILKAPSRSLAGRRVCVLVHFDPNDRLDPYVVHYMAALKATGLDVVLISSSDLEDEAVAEISPMLDRKSVV